MTHEGMNDDQIIGGVRKVSQLPLYVEEYDRLVKRIANELERPVTAEVERRFGRLMKFSAAYMVVKACFWIVLLLVVLKVMQVL